MICGIVFIEAQFEELIIPSIWESSTFINKVGEENRRMMWSFKDQGDRDVCLIPEVTGLIQEMWNTRWPFDDKIRNIFYVSKCYRYERPQLGRYREFTQFGIEMLGETDLNKSSELLKKCLDKLGVNYTFSNNVKRGLNYYTDDGFEASVFNLGAQNQIAGGGKYREGCGWAIGIDRIVLSKMKDV